MFTWANNTPEQKIKEAMVSHLLEKNTPHNFGQLFLVSIDAD
jgi:hypothetical protein